jgi:tellurite resistance protein TehA-like permease
MQRGKRFEESLTEALQELAPDGLHRIEIETQLLLNAKMINMKKLTYLLGSVSAMAMSFGWLLRVLRMGELGNAVFAFGALGFAALFLPLMIINYFRDHASKHWADKLRFVSGAFSAIVIAMAFLLKIMHMPGADEVLWTGGILFTFIFLPSFFFTLYRKSVSATHER